MSRRLSATVVGALLALSFGLVGAAEGKAKSASKSAGGGKATLVPVDKLDWKDAANFPPGVKMAALWGEANGSHALMMKLPAGLSAPLHHHTSDHEVTVVSGTLVLTPEGESATKLPPGSAFHFTGKKRHTTACEAGADCVLALEVKGAWDLVMDDKKK